MPLSTPFVVDAFDGTITVQLDLPYEYGNFGLVGGVVDMSSVAIKRLGRRKTGVSTQGELANGEFLYLPSSLEIDFIVGDYQNEFYNYLLLHNPSVTVTHSSRGLLFSGEFVVDAFSFNQSDRQTGAVFKTLFKSQIIRKLDTGFKANDGTLDTATIDNVFGTGASAYTRVRVVYLIKKILEYIGATSVNFGYFGGQFTSMTYYSGSPPVETTYTSTSESDNKILKTFMCSKAVAWGIYSVAGSITDGLHSTLKELLQNLCKWFGFRIVIRPTGVMSVLPYYSTSENFRTILDSEIYSFTSREVVLPALNGLIVAGEALINGTPERVFAPQHTRSSPNYISTTANPVITCTPYDLYRQGNIVAEDGVEYDEIPFSPLVGDYSGICGSTYTELNDLFGADGGDENDIGDGGSTLFKLRLNYVAGQHYKSLVHDYADRKWDFRFRPRPVFKMVLAGTDWDEGNTFRFVAGSRVSQNPLNLKIQNIERDDVLGESHVELIQTSL